MGAYTLTVADARCESSTDCGCDDEQCDGAPESPGLCVPLLTGEGGPSPFPIALGERAHGPIDAPYETDLFAVDLAAGVYDVETLGFCASETDTELTLLGPDGEPVATDADSGEGFFAALSGVVVPEAGTLVIEIGAHGAGVGSCLVRVHESAGP